MDAHYFKITSIRVNSNLTHSIISQTRQDKAKRSNLSKGLYFMNSKTSSPMHLWYPFACASFRNRKSYTFMKPPLPQQTKTRGGFVQYLRKVP
jgi:hypothetical protein